MVGFTGFDSLLCRRRRRFANETVPDCGRVDNHSPQRTVLLVEDHADDMIAGACYKCLGAGVCFFATRHVTPHFLKSFGS